MNGESVKKWIAKADGDLKVGKNELKSEKPVTEAVCFHMQQCVEKYLKALLIFHNQEFRKTHDLSELIEQCREVDPDFEKLLELNADRLTEYVVELRHPSDLTSPSLSEAKQAVRVAEQTKEFIRAKLRKYGLKMD